MTNAPEGLPVKNASMHLTAPALEAPPATSRPARREGAAVRTRCLSERSERVRGLPRPNDERLGRAGAEGTSSARPESRIAIVTIAYLSDSNEGGAPAALRWYNVANGSKRAIEGAYEIQSRYRHDGGVCA